MAIEVYCAMCSDPCEKANQEQICRVHRKLYGVVQDLTYEHFDKSICDLNESRDHY